MERLKKQAQNVLTRAIAKGLLAPAKDYMCANCGNSRLENPDLLMEYHHENYSKPLDVIPLCHKCHLLRHKEMDSSFRSRKGTKLSEDQISKMSELTKKQWVRRKEEGYVLSHSEETKRRISEAVKKSWESRRK
jgi:hypothetical protein